MWHLPSDRAWCEDTGRTRAERRYRSQGSKTNYPMYSDIMKTLGDFGVVWTEGNIDRWIANPKAVLPGAYMTMFPGVPDASDRADIIAYLKTFPPQ